MVNSLPGSDDFSFMLLVEAAPIRVLSALPCLAKSHGYKPVDECEVRTLRSLGEGECASEGSTRRRMWRGATAVRP
jgi:hypothetical protein